MKASDSLSYRAVDGDEGSHQNTLLESKNNDDGFPHSHNETDVSSYTCRDSELERPTTTNTRAKKYEAFNFDSFLNSSQFSLALEILRWFQAEKLPAKPNLLNENQVKKLKSVTAKYAPGAAEDTQSNTSNTTDLVDIDTKFYELPPPRVTASEPTNRSTSEYTDRKADEILQKLIYKIESKYKKKPPSAAQRKVYYQKHDTTTDSTETASSEEPTVIRIIQSKPHKRKNKKVGSSYYKLCESEKAPKPHRCANRKEETMRVYIRDQAVQTEEPISNCSSKETFVQTKKKQCYFSDGGRPGTDTTFQASAYEDDVPGDITQTLSNTQLSESPEKEKCGQGEEDKKANSFLWKNRCSLAWYEPIESKHMPQCRKVQTKKVETLQDLLIASKPEFVSRLKERQRLLSITAEERKLQAMWKLDREKLFGKTMRQSRPRTTKSPFPSTRPFQPKKRAPMTRSEMVKFSKERYSTLPEVKQHKVALKRKQEYAANRENQRRFNKKVQSHVLKKHVQNY